MSNTLFSIELFSITHFKIIFWSFFLKSPKLSDKIFDEIDVIHIIVDKAKSTIIFKPALTINEKLLKIAKIWKQKDNNF